MSMHIRRLASIGVLLALILAFAPFGTGPQTVDAQSAAPPSDSLRPDAQLYAEHMGVSIDEALRRFRIQELAGELDAKLSASEAPTFAGLWLEHAPQFQVVVQFTRDSEQTIKPYLVDHELAGVIALRSAKVTLVDLQRAQAEAHTLTRSWGIQAESGINVQENRTELYVSHREQLERTLHEKAAIIRWPQNVEILGVPAMGKADADIYGGLSLSTCTSGFAVRNSSGTRGISTAAHCSNAQSYSGTSLTYRGQRFSGSYDVQWHTAPGYTVRNRIRWWSDGTTRDITGTVGRSSQAVGGYVCKYGKRTFYTCGYISDKNYAPSYVPSVSATFIRVNNTAGYSDLSGSGDSGGPWFLTSNAYGTHSGSPGADPNDALYMAINYISGLGVSVLTSP